MEFTATEQEILWIESRVWPTRRKHFQEGGSAILIGLLTLWIVVAVIGWVVRGFLGVPRGSDQRVSDSQ